MLTEAAVFVIQYTVCKVSSVKEGVRIQSPSLQHVPAPNFFTSVVINVLKVANTTEKSLNIRLKNA